MIVRTYTRRSRCAGQAFSDGGSPRDGDDGMERPLSLSQEASSSLADPYGFAAFSSQGSSAWSFDSEVFGTDDSTATVNPNPPLPPLPPPPRFTGNSSNDLRKPKDPKNVKIKKPEEPFSGRSASLPQKDVPRTSTATLMEVQEFGETMEHVDEVTFALGGLRRGQPARIRQASLSSLLSICESPQQRRLLRARGMSKKIIDAITGMSIDDYSCGIAAATLFYVLATDVPDDYLLDSPSSVHFLLKLLNPRGNGSDLTCAMRKYDSSSTAIMKKVEDILSSCKVLKRSRRHDDDDDDGVTGRPELSPRWIALVTIEKACLSAVSIQDTSGSTSRVGGNFKERLRKSGGLDAIFNVVLTAYSRMKGRLDTQNVALLLKCFKIMENATFLSSDNQNHLLRMKANADDEGLPLSFVGLVINAIKIFSDLSLRQTYPHLFEDRSRVSSGQRLPVAQKSNPCQKRQRLSLSATHDSDTGSSERRLNCPTARSTGAPNGWISINIRKSKINSGNGSSSSGSQAMARSKDRGVKVNVDPFAFDAGDEDGGSKMDGDGSNDPFAFEEDEVGPTKWEILANRKVGSWKSQSSVVDLESEDGGESAMMGTLSHVDDEGASVLEECLLAAVKVLMNLTNDNPEGCRQIAACGGLNTLASLIGSHFPSFDFFQTADYPSDDTAAVSKSSVDARSSGSKHLSDLLGLDFLVAILGLLVNLVEKDDRNRSRLASATVPVAHSGGREDRDVISLLCSIFLSNRGSHEASGEEKPLSYDDEFALMQGEREAEMMIIEAYAALLLAFLSTESVVSRRAIAACLPDQRLDVLVPVLERFVAFHVSLNMISPETHQIVDEVIESCRGS